MTNDKRKLKNLLLATASTFVMLSASNAMAAVVNVAGAKNTTGDAVDTHYRVTNNAAILNVNDAGRTLAVGIAAGISPADPSTFDHSFTLDAFGDDDTGNVAGGVLDWKATANNVIMTLSGAGAAGGIGGGVDFATPIAANDITTYNKLGAVDGDTHTGVKLLVSGATAHGLTISSQITKAGLKLGADAHSNMFDGELGTDAVPMNSFEVLNNNASANTFGVDVFTKIATLSGTGGLAFSENVTVTEGGWAPTAVTPVTFAADKNLTTTGGAINTGAGLLTMAGAGTLESTTHGVTIGAGGFTNVVGAGVIKGGTGVIFAAGGIINAGNTNVTATTGNVVASGAAAVHVQTITATDGDVDLSGRTAGGNAITVDGLTTAHGNVITGASAVTATGGIVAATGNVTTGAGAVTGAITATAGNVSAGGNITGNVTAGGAFTNTAASTITGTLTADGMVTVADELTVTGATSAGGINTTAAKGVFGGTVTSTEDIIAGRDSRFNGNVTATGKDFKVLDTGAVLNANLSLGNGKLDITDSGAIFSVTGDRTITAKAITGNATDSFTITGSTILKTSLGSVEDPYSTTPTLHAIGDLVVPSGKTVTLDSTNEDIGSVAAITSADGTSNVAIAGGNAAYIWKNLGTDAQPHAAVTLTGNTSAALMQENEIHAVVTNFAAADALWLFEGSKVYSNIVSQGGAGNGVINVQGNSEIIGELSDGVLFGEVTFSIANKKLVVTPKHAANAIDSRITTLEFNAADTVLEYGVSTGANTTVTVTNATANTDGSGTLKFTGDTAGNILSVVATGFFGAIDKNIGMIDAGTNDITLDGPMYVKDVKAGVVSLAAAGTYGFFNTDATEVISYNAVGATTFAARSQLTERFIPVAGSITTVQNGVTFNRSLFADAGGNSGAFVFNGSNSAPALGSQARPATLITVNSTGLDSTTFTDVVFGPISLVATGKATIEADINGDLDAAGANGIYTFTNADDVVITGRTGDTTTSHFVMNTVKAVEIQGVHDGASLSFTQAGTFKMSTAGSVLGTVDGAAVDEATVIANANYTVAADIAEDAAPLGEFQLLNNATLTVNNNRQLYAKLVSSPNGRGDVNFLGVSNSPQTNWGTAAKPHDSFTTQADGVVQGDIYAAHITTLGTLTGKNVISANPITLGDLLSIADGGSVSETTGAHVTTLLGTATVTGDLPGGLTSTGHVSSTVTLSTGLLTGPIIQSTAKFVLTENTVFAGTYNVTGGTLAMADGNMPTFENALTMDDMVITFDYVSGQDVVAYATTAPHLNTGILILKPDHNGPAHFPKNGTVIKVFAHAGAGTAFRIIGATADNVVYNTEGLSFIKAAPYDPATGTITITSRADVADLVANTASPAASDLAATIADDINAGRAAALGDYLEDIAGANARSSIIEGLANQSTARAVSGAATAAASSVLARTTEHLANVTGNVPGVHFAEGAAGVASGDTAERFGVWAEALAGMGTQKAHKSEDGFKSKWVGGIIGADTMISDKSVIGITIAGVNNTIKLTDSSAGSKIKAPSWVFGAYGSYDFGNNFFAQANLAIAQVSAKANTVRATGAGLTNTATAKFDVMTSAAELRAGYNYRVDNVVVTPTAGARIDYIGDTSFTETSGVAALNEKISTKAATTISAVAGLKLATAVDMSGTTVMPEAHMNLKYAFSAQNPKSSFAVGGGSLNQYKGPKPSRYGANVGFSLTAQAEGFEYGVGYDATIADKYLGHQGSVKLKVKF